jgi:hypothetical protein
MDERGMINVSSFFGFSTILEYQKKYIEKGIDHWKFNSVFIFQFTFKCATDKAKRMGDVYENFQAE